jgi:hypothetical protein
VSVLPAMSNDQEAAALLRELFRQPSPDVLALATPSDSTTHDTVLRYLHVALADLPPEQSQLLRRGAALLLADPELCGHLVPILGDGDDATAGAAAGRAAAALVAGGELRGVTVYGVGSGDLHALLLGLCARFDTPPPADALQRDAADARYRDLVVLLTAACDLELLGAIVAGPAGLDPRDEHAVEALGRSLQQALQRHGEEAVLALFVSAPRSARAMLLAGLQEALEPAYLALLSEAQRIAAFESLRRRALAEPGNAYLGVSSARKRREAVLERARHAMEQHT